MERYLQRGFYGNTTPVRFGLGGETTTVNRMATPDLHCIMTHLFISLRMFSVSIVHKNDEFLRYQFAAMIPFMPTRHNKRHDLS